MKTLRSCLLTSCAAALLGLSVLGAAAQAQDLAMAPEKAPVPFRVEPYLVTPAPMAAEDAESARPFHEEIRIPGATWLQVRFGDYDLGENSYLTVTGIQDGVEQRLTAKTLPQAYGVSAIFNGEGVDVDLHIAPGDSGVFVDIQEVNVGQDPFFEESQCGGTDDRTQTTNNRVGRIMPVGCTGWIIASGIYLTAGHCIGASDNTLEFNVPNSLSNGATQSPGPNDQYTIDQTSIVFFNDGAGQIGNDWALFRVNPNANTGLLPVQAYGGFYRVTHDHLPPTSGDNIRITGYGLDFDDLTFNQTLQTHIGPFVSETIEAGNDVVLRYQVDTEGGNSGSPVIVRDIGGSHTIGIHTNAGCGNFLGLPTGSNSGTSFENNDLENAINTASGSTTEYVDGAHVSPTESGTVFHPWDTVAEAASAVPSGGTVAIVQGTYTAAGLVIDGTKGFTITAPVGTVTLQ